MTTIAATFRTVDADIFNQLEQAIRLISTERQASATQIQKMRKRAACLLQRRSMRLRRHLEQTATRELAQALQKQQTELKADYVLTLARCHRLAREVTIKTITEMIGSDARLVSQTALNRLASLFTMIGKQSGLCITFSPEDSSDTRVQDYCTRYQLETNVAPTYTAGNFRISLPSGTIDSLLSDDITHLVEHFTPDMSERAPKHE